MMETVEWIVQRRVDEAVGEGNAAVRHYMDDLVCEGRNLAISKIATAVMLATCKELGIPLADKDQLNVSAGIHLGIQYDSAAQALRMPKKKRNMLYHNIDSAMIRKKTLQSVVGKLTWGNAQWFRSRPLINPLLHTVTSPSRDRGWIRVLPPPLQACREWQTTTTTTTSATATTTTTTTSTSAPCFAVPSNRDAALVAKASKVGFVVVEGCDQALTDPFLNAIASLCDTANGLGPTLDFAALCPASCRRQGVCPTPHNWLALGANQGGARQAPDGKSWMFSGRGPGLRLLGTAALSSHVSEAMSIAIHFRSVPGSGGYLFAKTSSDGVEKRYWSLYLSAASNQLRVYTVDGNGAQLVLRFKPRKKSMRKTINFADGNEHKLLLVRDGTSVWLKADGKQVGDVQSLGLGGGGGAADCSIFDSNCESWVGQRASAAGGAYRFKGYVHSLTVYHNSVLAAFPGGWQG